MDFTEAYARLVVRGQADQIATLVSRFDPTVLSDGELWDIVAGRRSPWEFVLPDQEPRHEP